MRKESNKNNDKLIHLSRFLFGDTSVTSVNADDETIEWNHTIEFDTSLDLVKINHFCDLMLVELVRSRMKELNMH